MPNIISARDLTCIRSQQVLFKELNLELNSGECLHVIGANGSGKSSLLRILCGLLIQDSGEIYWNKEPTKRNLSFLSSLAYIGHKDGLKNELTAAENLQFYQSCDTSTDTRLIDDYLAQLGILAYADLTTQSLSFGQRRRLAFARLLIQHYPIWILDEPFTGIDHAGRQLIESFCLKHLQHQGMIILTNHQDLKQSQFKEHLQELTL